jgi:hypothetical protein
MSWMNIQKGRDLFFIVVGWVKGCSFKIALELTEHEGGVLRGSLEVLEHAIDVKSHLLGEVSVLLDLWHKGQHVVMF